MYNLGEASYFKIINCNIFYSLCREACAAIEDYYRKRESGEVVNVTQEGEEEAFDRLMGKIILLVESFKNLTAI